MFPDIKWQWLGLCVRISTAKTIVSGSKDKTLKIWDVAYHAKILRVASQDAETTVLSSGAQSHAETQSLLYASPPPGLNTNAKCSPLRPLKHKVFAPVCAQMRWMP